jgi:sulfur relay (sulfurtransferase) DsrC/TusE family protein
MTSYITSPFEEERIKQIYRNKEKYMNELNSLKVEPKKEIVHVILCDNDREITKEYVINFIRKYLDEYIILYTVRSLIKQITPIVKVTERVIELIDKLFVWESSIEPDFNKILINVLNNREQFEFLEMYTKTIYIIA